jgi:hypothetical protein
MDPSYVEIMSAPGTLKRDKTDRSYERPLRVTREAQAMPF